MVMTKYAASAGSLIHGVKTKPLRLVPDERGWLMEITAFRWITSRAWRAW
jgi:dTDP-4-dehydrorhamnose 3,5-epimerase-like enzyme